jgi:hypothetical protein
VSLFQITHAERAAWQRRAVTELATILDVYRDLPVIAWRVASAGATLTGRINGLAPADQVRASFQRWQVALDIGAHTETPSDPGVAYLHAVTHRNRVGVGLAATVFDHDGGHR